MNKKQFDLNNELPVLEITSSEDALIRIDRLPAVEEFFSTMYEPVSQRINAVLSAECTEETRLDAEKSRAEIRQFKADIKAALKKAESQLYEPWERVLEKAQNLTNLCDKADLELKGRIDAVKDKLKKEKFDELVIYYDEKCSVLGLEWLEIDRVIPCIRLNDSLSKLRKALDATLEKIYADGNYGNNGKRHKYPSVAGKNAEGCALVSYIGKVKNVLYYGYGFSNLHGRGNDSLCYLVNTYGGTYY